MPYIGNNHIAGDHTNNFKVLDDISSYTATFDGSATSVVDTTNNTIRVVEHRFIQGQRVVYTNGSGGDIGGLNNNTAYFIIFDTANTVKLATNASNAASSTAINLSSVGTGTSHTFNAAFDGINTKFKITYNGGTGARFNNATQLNIAINNVLQKPNVDSITFTEGFAIEDNHKIVFKTAPTEFDIFWGSIIANTLTTFDISDHKIDTFTGDGSTTEFTLSHTPANNESLMVTINGVLQHPSNASTARAYTLIASIIQFTAAPGVGDEIQVRHMGFAGATTADVSGFYGRTGNVVLTSNDHITTGNINAGIVTATTFDGAFSSSVGGSNANFTGIVTAGVFKGGDIEGGNLKITGLSTFVGDTSFTGNVSIGGTLTYEDVTNIDSVGIVTARDGIKVGSGVTILSNGRAEFTGFTTFSAGAQVPYNKNLVIGPSSLYGSIGYLSGFSGLQFQALNQMKFSCWDGNSIEQFLFASGVGGYVDILGTSMGNSKAPRLRVQGKTAQAITMSSSDGSNLTERFKLSQSGFNFTGLSTHTGNFDLDGDLDVAGTSKLSGDVTINRTTGLLGSKLSINKDADQEGIGIQLNQSSGITTSLTTFNSAGSQTFSLAHDTDGTPDLILKLKHSTDSAPAEKLRITSDGKVGIGNETPGSKLSIVGGSIGSGAIDALELKHITANNSGDGTALLFNAAYNNNPWAFAKISAVNSGTGFGGDLQVHIHPADGTQGSSVVQALSIVGDGSSGAVVRIPNGKVGIGTAIPSGKLNLVGSDSQIFNIVQDTGDLTIRLNDRGSSSSYIKIPDGSGALTFETGGDERLRITSSGIVQISQSAPQLQLKDSDGTNQLVQFMQSGGATYLDLRDNTSDGQLIIRGKGGDTATEKLRITSGGTVQIGGATANSADIDSTNTKLTIKQSANSQEDGIYIERSGERRGHYIYVGGAHGQSDALCVSTNQLGGDTDLLAIDRGGNVIIKPGKVGIGYESPVTNLDVRGSSDASITIGLDNGTKYGNFSCDNSATYLYAYNGNDIIFSTHSGNSFNRKVTIKNDGKFGIGEASPDNQLHIAGTTTHSAGGLLRLDVTTGDNFIIFDNTSDSSEWAVGNDSTARNEFRLSYNGGSGYNSDIIRIDGTTNNGVVTIDSGTNTLVKIKADSAGTAGLRCGGDGSQNQSTGFVEVHQDEIHGGGIFYNGDGSPAFATNETADHISLYRMSSGTRYSVMRWVHNSQDCEVQGNMTIDNGYTSGSTVLKVKADSSGTAGVRIGGDGSQNQCTGYVEVHQDESHGGGIFYNGDGSPSFATGETADRITFYRMTSGGRYEVFNYPHNSNNVEFNGSITENASDIRLKTNIKVIDNPIEKIKKIRGTTFDWVDDITSKYGFIPSAKHETGVIAQEIQDVVPDAVVTAPFNTIYTEKSGKDHNFLTVKPEKIIPLCIEAIKELSTEVENLKAEIAALKSS